jgi:hypothetical protein
MIRRVGQAVVLAMALLILIAEAQRYDDMNEAALVQQ